MSAVSSTMSGAEPRAAALPLRSPQRLFRSCGPLGRPRPVRDSVARAAPTTSNLGLPLRPAASFLAAPRQYNQRRMALLPPWVAKRHDSTPSEQEFLDGLPQSSDGLGSEDETDTESDPTPAPSPAAPQQQQETDNAPAAALTVATAAAALAAAPAAASAAALPAVAALEVAAVDVAASSSSSGPPGAGTAAAGGAATAAGAAAAAGGADASSISSHPIAVEEDYFASEELVKELTDPKLFGRRGEVLVFAQLATLALLAFPPIPLHGLIDFFGVLCITAGVVFMAYALLSLGRNFSPMPQPRKKHTLVVTGMYSYIRHPMYSGLLLASLGLAAITHSEIRLALSALLWYTLEQKMQYEERQLRGRYPEYQQYMAVVKKLIPFVY